MAKGGTAPQTWRRVRIGEDALRDAVEQRLAALAPPAARSNALNEAVRYALLAPGKRLRPILTVVTAWELGQPGLATLDAGCAVEMVHAASLVLDDLPSMDDAPLRRGRPSTHVAHGEDVAILASIALLSRAFSTLAGARHLDAATRASCVDLLAEAVGSDGLAGGQCADLRGTGSDGIAAANHLKTGALFIAAVRIAGAIAGAGSAETERLHVFATHLGQAFQLRDDLDDAGPSTDETGREDHGRATLVGHLGGDEVRSRLAGHLAEARALIRPDGDLARLVDGVFSPSDLAPFGFGPDRSRQNGQRQHVSGTPA